jgi:hypothetical protein
MSQDATDCDPRICTRDPKSRTNVLRWCFGRFFRPEEQSAGRWSVLFGFPVLLRGERTLGHNYERNTEPSDQFIKVHSYHRTHLFSHNPQNVEDIQFKS